MPSPPALLNPNTTANFVPAVPQNTYMTAQHIQHPVQRSALQEQAAPAPEFKMTLFHWQIQQESKKAQGLTADQLNMQDSDGDTYVWMKMFNVFKQEEGNKQPGGIKYDVILC